MTHDEFKQILNSFIRESDMEELRKIVAESGPFIEDAKKYDPILAEHIQELILDMQRVEQYIRTFYKLS